MPWKPGRDNPPPNDEPEPRLKLPAPPLLEPQLLPPEELAGQLAPEKEGGEGDQLLPICPKLSPELPPELSPELRPELRPEDKPELRPLSPLEPPRWRRSVAALMDGTPSPKPKLLLPPVVQDVELEAGQETELLLLPGGGQEEAEADGQAPAPLEPDVVQLLAGLPLLPLVYTIPPVPLPPVDCPLT